MSERSRSLRALGHGQVRTRSWPATAADTARAVLEWVQVRDTPLPPTGSLRSVDLLPADHEAVEALRAAARHQAARLGAGDPILGDDRKIGLGGLVLGLAVGARKRLDLAPRLALLAPPPSLGPGLDAGWADAVARHAVVGPSLQCLHLDRPGPVPGSNPESQELDPRLVTALLDASPLTSALLGPVEAGTERAFATAIGLLSRPRGGNVMVNVLSEPSGIARVLSWRSRLLARLGSVDPKVVRDVYFAALMRSGDSWRAALESAAEDLARSHRRRPQELSIRIVQYWEPLLARPVQQQLARAHDQAGLAGITAMIRRFQIREADAV